MNQSRKYIPAQYILGLVMLALINCDNSIENWEPLFNGKDLQGWHSYGDGVQHDGWYVENEELRFDFRKKEDPVSSYIVSDRQFTNFELSLEWKISEKGNSGVFWGVHEALEFKHPYETGPEIQVLDDNWTDYIEGRGDITRAGSLFGLMAPSRIVSKGPGEWNHFLIHVDHEENEGFVEFNGKEVLSFKLHGPDWDSMVARSSFDGWPGFGKYRTGHISLQDHGGKVAFKNIMIREIKSSNDL